MFTEGDKVRFENEEEGWQGMKEEENMFSCIEWIEGFNVGW